MERLTLITNPGSASRKYALYNGETRLVKLHFEDEDGKVICTLKDASGQKRRVDVRVASLAEAATVVPSILTNEGFISDEHSLAAVITRIVAPGDYFLKDRIIDDEFMARLEEAKKRTPIHSVNTANEITIMRQAFAQTPFIAVSDSAFHSHKPELTSYYSIDKTLADQYDIKRYGYHGFSYGYISRYLKERGLRPEKFVAMHLGSGASVTAILNGKSYDTSMGYSPLEGVTMSTRAGSMDVAAGLAVKRALGLQTDEEVELYLNKQSGLLGLSGQSGDLRDVISLRAQGDPRAELAYSIYAYRIQAYVGQMAAAMNGADALVFAGTIGERSDVMRASIAENLTFLGFELDPVKNANPTFEGDLAVISAENSKPIYIVASDESAQMVFRANKLLNKLEQNEA